MSWVFCNSWNQSEVDAGPIRKFVTKKIRLALWLVNSRSHLKAQKTAGSISQSKNEPENFIFEL
jgi:hypothetical protein